MSKEPLTSKPLVQILMDLVEGICPSCGGTDLHSASIDSDEAVSCCECNWISSYKALRARTPADETSDEQMKWDTIAQNTRLLSALTKVTESWVNGRRVMDGVPLKVANEARQALELRPAEKASGGI